MYINEDNILHDFYIYYGNGIFLYFWYIWNVFYSIWTCTSCL